MRGSKSLLFAGWLLGWAFAAAGSAEPPAASKDWTAVLTQLEAAVAADPESLKNESEYRMAVIQAAAYERALGFYQKLVADHPQSAQAALNYGYAYVDKIPASGSITQVILANTALGWFTKSVELQRTWLALYTRGNSYLYWPKVFGRAPLGVADLEEAVKLAKTLPKRAVYARAYVALGEGYWKIDEIDKARAAWTEGEKLFPDNVQLKALLARQGDDLKAYIEDEIDPNKRVDTNLRPLWENP